MTTVDDFAWSIDESGHSHIVVAVETRDAEWQARVDAARREGWEAGVRAALDVHQERPPSEHYEASQEITALIARGTK